MLRNDLYNEKWGHGEEGGTKSNLRQTISFVLLQSDKHNPTPASQQGRVQAAGQGWHGPLSKYDFYLRRLFKILTYDWLFDW